MNNRNYNIYFHTHTISGIIICALLYVIFFAGSFSFFKDEISSWQNNSSYVEHPVDAFPYQSFLDSLDKKYDLTGRDLTLYFYANSPNVYVNMSPSQDTIHNKKPKESAYFNYNLAKKEEKNYVEAYDMAEFLYRLHFLAQLNQVIPVRIGYPIGYIIAGIVSFLFLFALITGLLLHWDKIVSNFYQFRPWSKWKTVWTDIHTVLGVIGFPFQFVFAVTGVILIINTVFLTPFSHLLYKGDENKIYQELEYNADVASSFTGKSLTIQPSIQGYINQTQALWPKAFLKRVTIKNYHDEGMLLVIEADADTKRSFSGTGMIAYNLHSGKVVHERSPYESPTYVSIVKSAIYRLHLADYGGYFVKIVNFILGITGCIVIISGILIWLVARDKNSVPAHKRKFNFWLSNIFLAICLSMFPVTAFTFLVLKATGQTGQSFIYTVYFYSWLILSLYYIMRKNLNRTNRETLLLGSILSLAVAFSSGFYSGNWLWATLSRGATDIFFLDLLWIVIAIISFFSYLKIRTRASKSH